jgi:hypothetical protein
LCYACMKIVKYLDLINNLKMSYEVKLQFIDLEKASENSTIDFHLIELD